MAGSLWHSLWHSDVKLNWIILPFFCFLPWNTEKMLKMPANYGFNGACDGEK